MGQCGMNWRRTDNYQVVYKQCSTLWLPLHLQTSLCTAGKSSAYLAIICWGPMTNTNRVNFIKPQDESISAPLGEMAQELHRQERWHGRVLVHRQERWHRSCTARRDGTGEYQCTARRDGTGSISAPLGEMAREVLVHRQERWHGRVLVHRQERWHRSCRSSPRG